MSRVGLIAALSGLPAAAEAAFLLPEGATQIISGYGLSGFSQTFDAGGRLRRGATFSKTSLDSHYSYGLTQQLTLVATTSSDQLRSPFASDPANNLSWNAMAGLRAPLWRSESTIISAQAMAGWGRDRAQAGFMGEVRLMAGRNIDLPSLPGFAPLPGFADVQLAYRHGAPGARPELRLDATLGIKPSERFMVLAQIFTAYGFAGADQTNSLRIKGQLGVVWHAGETWSVQLSGFHTLYGINAALESGAVLSLWRRF